MSAPPRTGEDPDRHDVSVDLGLPQVEVGAAEERQDEGPAWHTPAILALDSAEDRDREPFRRSPRPRRCLGRQLAERPLEVARRPRPVRVVETLRELLEREPARSAVLAQRGRDALSLGVGGAE